MHQSIRQFCQALQGILGSKLTAVYLYGSVTLNDFREGWSDIDILCLTREAPSEEEASQLVALRQTLTRTNPANPYFRLLEGAVVSADELKRNTYTLVVYWGTSGQRITDTYTLDVFSRYEWLTSGTLIYGDDVRHGFDLPSYADLCNGVRDHLRAIRDHARKTNESLYSCGWLLDIARCIYTLRQGNIISKTAAGEWALTQRLCPDGEALARTLEVRRDPLVYKESPNVKAWLCTLGTAVHSFADVLEAELARIEI